ARAGRAGGLELARRRAAIAVDGIAVVALLHRVDDAVAARHAARPEARLVEGGRVDEVALGVGERVAGGGAALRRGAALEAVPAELRDLGLTRVGGMEAVAARHVARAELEVEGTLGVADVHVGRLDSAREREPADRNRRVLGGHAREDLV